MSLLKNAGTIGGLTAVSRVFGFARDILLARVLGATAMGDAWQLAFMLPNIFRRLFAEGAFSSAFVPLFNRRMGEDGEIKDAENFAAQVLSVLLPILIAFGGLAMIAMPWVISFFAPQGLSDDATNLDIAIFMGRVTFPYLMFMSIATLDRSGAQLAFALCRSGGGSDPAECLPDQCACLWFDAGGRPRKPATHSANDGLGALIFRPLAGGVAGLFHAPRWFSPYAWPAADHQRRKRVGRIGRPGDLWRWRLSDQPVC